MMHTSSQPGTRLGVVLSLALSALFAGFIAAAAFNPALFARPVFAGGVVTLWFAYGLGLIWTTVLVIGVYVAWVNAREGQP